MEEAIAAAERGTSAQLKVVLARHCWLGLRRKAHRLFLDFGMDRLPQRNGVLILLISGDHRFLVYGDRGVHEHLGRAFWNSLRDAMQARFRTGEFAEGLCAGVEQIGSELTAHFPKEGMGDEVGDGIEFRA